MMPLTNRGALDRLFQDREIDLRRSSLFKRAPTPLSPDWDFGFFDGMMLGLAIGDALGTPTESWLPRERRAEYGEIRDYTRHPEGPPGAGLPSDDTQLAFWTLEQLLCDGGLDPDHLADRFCRDWIFGIGATVEEFIENRETGLPWHQCGPRSAGNGALMRIAPILAPHLRSPTPDLWADVAVAAMLTHNDSASTASCLAFVNILWDLLPMAPPPDPWWWLESFVSVAREAENGRVYRPRGGVHLGYEGPLWSFVESRVSDAYRRDLSVLEAGNGWYSGAFLLETVPTVLYILMRHGHDPEEAIVRAVNDTKDNDTVAAIVGAAVGALHGEAALPSRWKARLLGRTTESDDGRVFQLLREARAAFWEDRA